MQLFQFDIGFGFRAGRVNDRKDNKGAEHVQDQCRDDKSGVEHGHIGTDNRQRNRRHRRCSHRKQAARGEIAQHALVGNEVFRLTEYQ